jgi:hypothetical protein
VRPLYRKLLWGQKQDDPSAGRAEVAIGVIGVMLLGRSTHRERRSGDEVPNKTPGKGPAGCVRQDLPRDQAVAGNGAEGRGDYARERLPAQCSRLERQDVTLPWRLRLPASSGVDRLVRFPCYCEGPIRGAGWRPGGQGFLGGARSELTPRA